jgi:endonuclease YncB( thermonuclease family)
VIAHLSSGALAQSPQSLGCGLEAGPSRAIAAVIDGDTLRLDDGKLVRLLGILAPKDSDSGTTSLAWPPAAAATKYLDGTARAKTAALAFTGPREDRHGRVLAHVFLVDGDKVLWLQRMLVEEGHARIAPQPGDSCARHLHAVETAAREASRGLWQNAAYQVRPADRPTELARYMGTFQLVAGRIARVVHGRGAVTLDLESSERGNATSSSEGGPAFRILVSRRQTAAAADIRQWRAGDDVRVRGWITGRSLPQIEIMSTGALEASRAGASDAGARPGPPQPRPRDK